MKIWVKKCKGLKKANRVDMEYYLKMKPEQRIETVQMLREMRFKLNGDEDRKGLRRVVRIVKQK
ncbi:MAG: hypothetical protein NC905_06095 [Candidatus Omnitrophica bacterium]|nr:hypothetical protein [Candidatus Omnitrophota bacterium]